jgi:hypothetical protein
MYNNQKNQIRRDIILGSKRFSNYFWSVILLFGGLGFLLSGLSSFLNINLLPFADPTKLVFIPQGIVMLFYGIIAISLSIYIILSIFWDIGGGYNEFNKIDSLIRISRNGFPGKNRQIMLIYSIGNIRSIKVSIQDGLNPKRIIYLCTKDERQIPLTSVEQPLSLSDLEKQASELAKFLEVTLEGI